MLPSSGEAAPNGMLLSRADGPPPVMTGEPLASTLRVVPARAELQLPRRMAAAAATDARCAASAAAAAANASLTVSCTRMGGKIASAARRAGMPLAASARLHGAAPSLRGSSDGCFFPGVACPCPCLRELLTEALSPVLARQVNSCWKRHGPSAPRKAATESTRGGASTAAAAATTVTSLPTRDRALRALA